MRKGQQFKLSLGSLGNVMRKVGPIFENPDSKILGTCVGVKIGNFEVTSNLGRRDSSGGRRVGESRTDLFPPVIEDGTGIQLLL